MEDYAVIVPKSGREKETIRLLLELADHRRHVKTNTDGPGLVLMVPEYLHKKYIESGRTEAPTAKRRGRPPGRPSRPAPVETETPESED